MSDLNIEAAPMSRKQIRSLALKTREALGFGKVRFVPIEVLLEFVLPKAIIGFLYDIDGKEVLGDSHGLADPDNNKLTLREDVYERACEGKGRDRATVIHELAHILLHKSDRMRHRRATGPMKAFVDPEWQAKAFAGEFLVASNLLTGFTNVRQVADEFGVSVEAATIQLKAYVKDGIIKKGQITDLPL